MLMLMLMLLLSLLRLLVLGSCRCGQKCCADGQFCSPQRAALAAAAALSPLIEERKPLAATASLSLLVLAARPTAELIRRALGRTAKQMEVNTMGADRQAKHNGPRNRERKKSEQEMNW